MRLGRQGQRACVHGAHSANLEAARDTLAMAMPWRCPMALPRDDSVFSGHIFDSVGTLGRYVNSAAAIVATAASTGLVKNQGQPETITVRVEP